MTITIINLKRNDAGRESIREREYKEDSVSIGRDSGSDISINDLSLNLAHARLKRGSDGLAILELTDGSTARVNGRLKSGRTANLKPGTVIRLGRYELRLEKPRADDDLVATLEQVELIEAKITSDDELQVFSLKSAMPSKRLMAWVFALAVFGFFLAYPVWSHKTQTKDEARALPVQADLAWNTGPVSLMHTNLMNDCQACHEKPFQPVQDKACAACHEDTADHADPADMKATAPEVDGFDKHLRTVADKFGRDAGRCVDCHTEHNSKAHIIPLDQKMCASCHEGLSEKLPKTEFLNVADFGNDHPQFRPSVITKPDYNNPGYTRTSLDDDPKGFSGLKFPHDLHLKEKGGVAKMAATLGARYGFEDGVGCADCHREEAGGALFDPVNMQQDCAMCHSLGFEDDDGYLRTLRHGEPNEVIATMRDFYQAKALGNIRDAEMNSSTRRRPGRAASLRDLNRRELAFKQADQRTAAKVDSIFSEGGACYDCHVIDRPADVATLDFKVRPISLNDRFYALSPFNHASHELADLTCESCHEAETSKTSNDVLLPKIAVCRDCHVGQESYLLGGTFKQGTLPSTCLTCHTYHGGDKAGRFGGSPK